MGLPRFHEQPVLLLMYRTIQNLDFVEQHKNHYGPFEVTQLINSFLAVIAHPWDQLLDKDKLKKVTIESQTFRECRFPHFPSLPAEKDLVSINNAYDLLRVLRNSIVHGNMELLDRGDLRRLRQTGPLPRVTENEIAGIRLWDRSTWSTALDIHELRQTITAMMRLGEKRSLWQDEVRRLQDQNDAARTTRVVR